MVRIAIALATLSYLLVTGVATGEVKPAALFADHMVLQRDGKIPLWGTADAGEPITITVGKEEEHATADPQGHWKVEIGPLAAGGPMDVTIVGKNTVTLHDVMAGDVWICSGQSNMEYVLGGTSYKPPKLPIPDVATKAVASANDPDMRLFIVKRHLTTEPSTDLDGNWAATTPDSAKDFSAVGYFFGSNLRHDEKVPIGLIDITVGGTPAETWVRRKTQEENPVLKPIVDRWDALLAADAVAQKDYAEKFADWQTLAAAAKANKEKAPPRPPQPHPTWEGRSPGRVFNGMIAPVAGLGIRGVIWYQGESNGDSPHPLVYYDLFPALIADWRAAWGRGDFPFIFVQLANFRTPSDVATETNWPIIRDAQRASLKVPNTGMAVAIDAGDAATIHPTNKEPVGHRLALMAESLVYGKTNAECAGPMYESSVAEGASIRVKFTHAKGLAAKDGAKVTGFSIAGADKKFVAADAKIDGESVIVSSAGITQPVAVRYAWADNPICDLYNDAGLPMSPFRTDDWELVETAPAK